MIKLIFFKIENIFINCLLIKQIKKSNKCFYKLLLNKIYFI